VSTLISDTPISTPNGSAETSLTGGSPVGGQQGEQLMLQYHPAVVVMVLWFLDPEVPQTGILGTSILWVTYLSGHVTYALRHQDFPLFYEQTCHTLQQPKFISPFSYPKSWGLLFSWQFSVSMIGHVSPPFLSFTDTWAYIIGMIEEEPFTCLPSLQVWSTRKQPEI
jgi:hypothetical protein